MAVQHPRILDGDGHVMEDFAGIAKFIPSEVGYTGGKPMFPPLHHFHALQMNVRGFTDRTTPPGPTDWVDFLDATDVATAVLYPSLGLTYGRITSRDAAVVLGRAYNDWLHETYLRRDPRFKGMALIPLQDVEAAVEELRRAVTELGMLGAIIPTRGLSDLPGDKKYWPVYAEADRLGCALATHGGVHSGMGYDQMNRWAAAHALGHPTSTLICFTSIIFNGILDKFPNARFAFLEGGVAWYLTAMERFDRSYTTFVEYDPSGDYGPHGDELPTEYIIRHIKDGRLFIGCEGDEAAIPFALREYGCNPFMYSSDFPHEVTIETCREEIQELRDNAEISSADKEMVLRENAQQLYRLGA